MLTLIYSFPVISNRIESVKFSWSASSSVVSLLVNFFPVSDNETYFDYEEAISNKWNLDIFSKNNLGRFELLTLRLLTHFYVAHFDNRI